MTEPPVKPTSPDREERAILDALEALEGGEPAAGAPGSGTRAYTELLGALGYAVEPVEPSPEVKRRLMAAVRERARAADSAPAGPEGEPAPTPLRRPAPTAPSRPAASRWLLPLAAAVAALAIGLSGWLYLRLEEREATIARLSRELSVAGEQAGQLARVRQELEAARRELAGQLAMVTAPGMVYCPLKPMDDSQPQVRGLMVMTPGGGPWLVRVNDLAPAPEGSVYVLWFLGRDAPHRAGPLEPGADRAAQLTSSEMPRPKVMTGVAVTLETSVAVERPSGPMILFGDQRIDMI